MSGSSSVADIPAVPLAQGLQRALYQRRELMLRLATKESLRRRRHDLAAAEAQVRLGLNTDML